MAFFSGFFAGELPSPSPSPPSPAPPAPASSSVPCLPHTPQRGRCTNAAVPGPEAPNRASPCRRANRVRKRVEAQQSGGYCQSLAAVPSRRTRAQHPHQPVLAFMHTQAGCAPCKASAPSTETGAAAATSPCRAMQAVRRDADACCSCASLHHRLLVDVLRSEQVRTRMSRDLLERHIDTPHPRGARFTTALKL